MGSWFLRLHALLRRRRALVVGIWLAVVALAVPLSVRQSDQLVGGNSQAPGSGSHRFERAAERSFGPLGEGIAILVAPGERTPDNPRRALARIADAVGAHPELELSPRVLEAAEGRLRQGRQAVLALRSDKSANELIDTAAALQQQLRGLASAHGFDLHLVGAAPLWAAVRDASKEELRRAESVGLPIVALILLAVFGSVLAAALPLVLGVGAVLLTGGVIHLVAQTMEMSVYVTNVASMIGIGVGVDYSLFLLARYRAEIARGRTAEDAGAIALSTAGIAIAFSGVAVVGSLATLWLVDVVVLRSIAVGVIVVVAFAVLLAITLLPVVIALMGRRAWQPGRVVGRMRGRWKRRFGARGAFWERHAARVMRRPVLSGGGAAAVLIVLALPVLALEPTAGPMRQLPPGEPTRSAVDRAASAVGGYASMEVLVSSRDRRRLARATRAALAVLRGDPEVTRAQPRARAGDSVLIAVATRNDPESGEASALVRRMRSRLERHGSPEARLHVGGEAARVLDVSTEIIGAMKWIVPALLVTSFVILVVLLRSIILPLKAVLMNLVAVAAAFGVLVVVFQWQWFGDVFGFHEQGAVAALTIPIVLAVCFGLSMDYEVLLLSRIRERFDVHGDSRRAVSEGLADTAGTITSAALIMTSVFIVFVFTGVASVKEIGLASALAVALDATLVRLVLVPAAMELLGRWNWWLPRGLERVLPKAESPRPQEA